MQAKRTIPSSDCPGHPAVESLRTEAGSPGRGPDGLLDEVAGGQGGGAACEGPATHHWGIGMSRVPRCHPEGRGIRGGLLTHWF